MRTGPATSGMTERSSFDLVAAIHVWMRNAAGIIIEGAENVIVRRNQHSKLHAGQSQYLFSLRGRRRQQQGSRRQRSILHKLNRSEQLQMLEMLLLTFLLACIRSSVKHV